MIRVSVLLVGLAGMCLAFRESSVLALWLVSGDLIYVTIFPQLICVLHCRRANGYGAVTGLVLSTALRGLSGEPLLSLPPVLLFPGWRRDPDSGAVSQYFPFRTAIMLLAMLSIPAVSLLAREAFARRLLPASWDVMGVLQGAEGPPAGRKGEGEEDEEEEEEGEEGEARAVPSAKENLLALSSAGPLVTSGRPESC